MMGGTSGTQERSICYMSSSNHAGGRATACLRPCAVFLFAVLLGACVAARPSGPFVGTWKMRDRGPGAYYLRIYPEGQAVVWPSPPDGEPDWTVLQKSTLRFGSKPPLHDPTLSRRGRLLVMHTNVGESLFDRTRTDLEPGQLMDGDR